MSTAMARARRPSPKTAMAVSVFLCLIFRASAAAASPFLFGVNLGNWLVIEPAHFDQDIFTLVGIRMRLQG